MRAAALLGVLLGIGCGDDLTEIVVVVDTDLQAPSEIDRITVTVSGPDGTPREASGSASDLPVTLGLTHEGGPLGPVSVTARAHLGADEVVARTATTEWIEGRRLMLRILLLRRCIDVSCGAGLTCGEELCETVERPASSLPAWRGRAPGFDGGVATDAAADACATGLETCNGRDDDCDEMVDEGIDLTVDPRNCGACGNDCTTKAGVTSAACVASECEVSECEPGLGDCNTDGADGCEATFATDVAHCGGCGMACSSVNATPMCAGATCSVTCNTGFENCDLRADTGCEADLTALTSCGRCGNRCTTTCAAGYCDDQVIVGVAAGSQHSCAWRRSGEALCWGSNVNGRLGDGTTVQRNVPQVVRSLTDATEVAAGDAHTCALQSGNVLCWGRNNNGQLGDGSTIDRNTPAMTASMPSTVSDIAVGAGHSCAVMASGNVRCWGDNVRGQLGDGTTNDRVTSVMVASLPEPAVEVVAGSAHSCARLASGAIACWGDNSRGQLGDGSTSMQVRPVLVLGITDAVQLAAGAGGNHTCARRMDGSVACFGDNAQGQLGDGTTTMATTFVRVDVAGASDLSAGAAHTCAVIGGDTVRCWGDNAQGQLGNDSTVDSTVPVTVVGLMEAAHVAAGNAHTCVRRADGSVACWGFNLVGQLGDGTTMPRRTPTAVRTLPF